EGGRPREVRVVGGDARPVARRAARLRAAAQAAQPLDRDTPEEHHRRRQVGVDDGSPVALPATQPSPSQTHARPVLAGRTTGARLYRAALTGLELAPPLPLVALVADLGASAWPPITRFGF